MLAKGNIDFAFGISFFLFLVTNHVVCGNTSCEKKSFLQEKEGQYLKKHIIETMATESASLCHIMCYLQKSCKSYNYQASSGVCQLSDSDEIENPGDFVYDPSYVYVGRENPCQKSPCTEHQVCEPNLKDGSRNCRPRDYFRKCADLHQAGHTSSGIYQIDPDGQGSFPVYCNMTPNGGAWTVFQKRFNGLVDFYRGWQDYKAGFGNLTGEFWLGLDKIHRLTKNKTAVLRVDVEYMTGSQGYAEYSSLFIADESDFYRLQVSGYSGPRSVRIRNNMQFSTFDKDNDMNEKHSCAALQKGGWWYNACQKAICWPEFTPFCWGLKSSQMKLK